MTVELSMASNEVAVAMLQARRDQVCDGPFDSCVGHPAAENALGWRSGDQHRQPGYGGPVKRTYSCRSYLGYGLIQPE